MTKLVLASTSPARLVLLRNGGIEPVTIAPGVDEDEVTAVGRAQGVIKNTADMVGLLARAKAEAVAKRPEAAGALVLGCDSSLEFEGESLGKPHQPEVALERWRAMRGHRGRLFSGHYLIDNRDPGAPKAVGSVSFTTVHFANITDAELAAYVGTGEPLKVAGAFTIDGLGGAYIERIDGDPHTVVGLSLPVLRQMVMELGLDYHSLWNRTSQ